MADKLVSAAQFARANAVPAFPLGGRVAVVEVSGTTPVSLAGHVDPKASLLLFSVPAGRTLYVGNAGQVDGLGPDDARALMLDFPGPAKVEATLVDDDEGEAVFLGDADFTLKILQAATLGAE